MPHRPSERPRGSLRVDPPWSLDAWRDAARQALLRDLPPPQIDWLAGADGSLLDAPAVQNTALPAQPVPAVSVPRDFLALAATCLCHRDPQRMPLLYRLLWRITHGERSVLSNPADPDVLRAMALAQAVRRDSHKMKAFVRFRQVPGEQDAFIAWFEPEHHIVDRVAPFFARRFAGMRWAILTPYRSARWDGGALTLGDGGTREQAPHEDAREDLWRTYYANIFNPARLNTRMMQQEMPAKYWKHLPEAQLLPALVRDAGDRVQEMHDRRAQAPRRRIPAPSRAPPSSIETPAEALLAVREAALACRRCPLWEPATQTVFGQGPANAKVMLVGEQPGDAEDLSGHPFVGPAGKLLDQALAALGVDRSTLYLTNAVKHFHFERRGKRRIHSTPQMAHAKACRPWLMAEIGNVRPQVIVCLGATAANAVLGSGFSLMENHGRWHALDDGTRAFATVHPAWVLRQPAGNAREAAYRLLLDDLAQLGQAQAAGERASNPSAAPT